MNLKKLLRNLLLRWQAGDLDEKGVHREAVAHEASPPWTQDEWPEYPDADPRSIVVEVLSQLSMLNAQWITRDDIPAILSFLDSTPGEEKQAWQNWEKYWEELDYRKRREEIAGNPFYSQSGPFVDE
ncbi:MAG: hypothetical protein ACREA0_21340 [bacterium]